MCAQTLCLAPHCLESDARLQAARRPKLLSAPLMLFASLPIGLTNLLAEVLLARQLSMLHQELENNRGMSPPSEL